MSPRLRSSATSRRPRRRTPTLVEAALPIVVMLVLVTVGTLWLGVPPAILLITAASFAGVLAWRLGVTWPEMQDGIRKRVEAGLPALLILISIGMLVGTWMAAGTIPMIVTFGLRVIEPSWIVLVSFLVTVVVSTMIGTSWGSVGTVGVALIGVAVGLGASLPMTAGAIIGGAYFGDKMSPLSDTTNMAPAAAGSTLFEHIRHLFYTTIPAAVVAVVVYVIIGLSAASSGHGDADYGQRDALIATLEHAFHMNVLLLLPAVVVLVGALLKKPPLPTILLSSAVAIVLALIFQNFSIAEVTTAAATGFETGMVTAHGVDPGSIGEGAKTLLDRGGMASMVSPVLIALAAFSFAGILTEARCLDVLMSHLLRRVRRTGSIIAATAGSSLGTALVTGSSYLTILIPGEAFRDIYPERGLAPKNLSRTLEDSGTVFVPLLPWSEAGAYMSATLGVAVIDYAPWAVLCYTGVIFAIICGYTGFGIARIPRKQPAQQPTETA